MKAFLTRPITFTKDKLKFTAHKGTPVFIIDRKEKTVLVLFKFFYKWIHQSSIKAK